jgi:hypothetical protein
LNSMFHEIDHYGHYGWQRAEQKLRPMTTGQMIVPKIARIKFLKIV